jgi:hypothetical protein
VHSKLMHQDSVDADMQAVQEAQAYLKQGKRKAHADNYAKKQRLDDDTEELVRALQE